MKSKHGKRLVVPALGLSVLLAACSGASDGGAGEVGADGTGGGSNADGVIRMVLSPDPVWDWLEDQGIKEEMEREAGMQILYSATWDRFGIYAGGHADVIVATIPELPALQEGTDTPTTVIGKYNADRGVLAVQSDNEATTLCDLEGQKIASYSFSGLTTTWSVYAQEMCGLELSGESDDFELVITDVQNLAGVVANGDAAGCICPPDFAIPQFMSGELKGLYDGRSATEIFADEFGEGHRGPMSNVFAAPSEWVESNPDEVAFFLEVWDRGLQEWQDNKAEIIGRYPQHFSATTPEQETFILDWVENRFDWFEDSVYLDQEWVDGESLFYDLMFDSGYLDEGDELPTFYTTG